MPKITSEGKVERHIRNRKQMTVVTLVSKLMFAKNKLTAGAVKE